jgi:hypothetical protein
VSLETLTFTEELRKLDAIHVELKQSEKQLRNFILSDGFLIDYIKFEQLLGDFQDKVVTLVELAHEPQPLTPQMQQALEKAEQGQQPIIQLPAGEKTFTMEKALVIVAAVVSCGIAVQSNMLPPIVLIIVIAAGVAFTFWPQVRELILTLLEKKAKKEEEPAPSVKLEDWINESLAKIRNLYTSARLLMKVQNQTLESLPQYRALGLDETLVSREKYFKETLPSEFLSRIGRIMVACDKHLWARKTLLINAITLSRQASTMQRGA